jgi:hypothetical protein
MHRNEKIYGLGERGGHRFEITENFDNPVTTDKCDYRFSHFFRREIFPCLNVMILKLIKLHL